MKMSDIVRRNIKYFRKKASHSQEHLAFLADIHRAYLGQVERGEKRIGIDNLQKIATSLNLDIKEFFIERYEDGDQNRNPNTP